MPDAFHRDQSDFGDTIDLLHHLGESFDIGLCHRIEPFRAIENDATDLALALEQHRALVALHWLLALLATIRRLAWSKPKTLPFDSVLPGKALECEHFGTACRCSHDAERRQAVCQEGERCRLWTLSGNLHWMTGTSWSAVKFFSPERRRSHA